jgi:hypothetical protein
MAQLNKGKLFLKCAAHALVVGLKEIPGVGMALDIGEGWRDIAREMKHGKRKKAAVS